MLKEFGGIAQLDGGALGVMGFSAIRSQEESFGHTDSLTDFGIVSSQLRVALNPDVQARSGGTWWRC